MKIKSAEFDKTAVWPEQYPQNNLPQIAFAGRSNVGKSSLLNVLVNRKGLARTSRTPGRTQHINFFLINGELFFVDLPGFGYAKAPMSVKKNWGKMVEKYLDKNEHLKLMVCLLDARRDPRELDIQLMSWLISHEVPFIYVVTKTDKLSRNELSQRLKIIRRKMSAPPDLDFIPFSAKTGKGKPELLYVIDQALRIP